MSRLLCAAFVLTTLFCFTARAESTTTCPSGYIDMVDWLTLDSDLRSSKHMTGTHDMYTVLWSDKFWWIKESTGSTWDINLYDNDYIYWWITQPTWGDARNYSMATYTTNFVAAPRCAASGYPGTGTNIVNNDTSHDIYFDCIYSNTANVGKAVFSVWGPYSLSFGGDLPNDMPVYILSYSWGCGDTFNDCVKEEYYLSQRYGLVAWQFYNNVNGQHVLNQTSIFNHLANGTVSPNFECF